MAKAIRTAATIVGAIATVVSFIPGPWQAPALLVSKVAAVVALAASAEIALTAKKPFQTQSGSQDKFTANKDQGVPIAFGRTAIAGYLVHRQTWDYGGSINNAYQTFFGVYSIGPIDSYESFLADGAAITFSGDAAAGGYAGYMWLNRHFGATPETTPLPASSFQSYVAGWTTASKMSGYAGFTWSIKFDDKGKIYPGAVVPAPLTVGKWVKAYDPRHDSTYPGGSGTQRANDPTSWAWTQNPWIAALQWAQGWWQNGKRIAGIGFALAAIDVPAFVNAANIADTNGFTCGGVAYSTDGKWDVLKKLAAAGSGQPLQLGGILSCECDAPRVSLATITTDQIIGDCTVTGAPSMASKINGVIPTYRSEAHQWSMVPAGMVQVAAYVTADGRPKTQAVTWDLVQDAGQVAKLAAYTICNAREFGPIVVPLKLRWCGYKPGDCLTIASDELGMSSQMVVITKRHLDPASGAVTLTMRSETYSKHAFCLGQTGTAPPTPSLQVIDRSALLYAGDSSGVGSWTPVLINMARAGGNFRKSGGASGSWDASVRSVEGFTGGAACSFVAPTATQSMMIGLNSDPITDNSYTSIDYAWYVDSIGDCQAYTNGTGLGPVNTYAAGDRFSIQYDGATVNWLKNNAIITSQAASAGIALFLDSSFATADAEADSVSYGPAGLTGNAGYTAQVITLYQRAATSPALPTNDCTYTFATQSFSPTPNNGWSLSVPTADGNPLWAIAATAYASTTTDTIAHGEWSSAVTITADGLSAATVFLFQRSATSPAGPSGALTYTFATGALAPSGNLNGWSTAVPGGTNPLWLIQATAAAPATIATDSITTGEWSTPVIHAQNGTDGSSGGNTAILTLYQRATSSPTLPSNDITYTFATGGMSPAPNNGWSASMPAVNGNPCWVTQASAFASGTTDAVAHTEWASPVKLVQDGANGSPGGNGTDGLNSAVVFLYQRATSTPSGPGGTLTYTFSTGVLSGTLGSWSQTIPGGTNPIYVIQATASAIGTTDAIANSEWSGAVILAKNGADGATGATGPAGSGSGVSVVTTGTNTGSSTITTPLQAVGNGATVHAVSSVLIGYVSGPSSTWTGTLQYSTNGGASWSNITALGGSGVATASVSVDAGDTAESIDLDYSFPVSGGNLVATFRVNIVKTGSGSASYNQGKVYLI